MRPLHLPDYRKPPLDEVVLGVQFTPVMGYNSLHSHEVWELFKNEYPVANEKHPIPPNFETFGGVNLQPSIQFSMSQGPAGSRLWFSSPTESHLLQFQSDRFLLNWRKRPDDEEYPRYEGVSTTFQEKLAALADYFTSKYSYNLDVNQTEISYINIIKVEEFDEIDKWFNFIDIGRLNTEHFITNFNEVISDENNRPYARMTYDIQSVLTTDSNNKAFRFALSFKGKPFGNDIGATMKFLELGRDKIVTQFNRLTTNEAHKIWGKI